MTKMYIRGLDEETSRRFKANAAMRGMHLAEYLALLVRMDKEHDTPNTQSQHHKRGTRNNDGRTSDPIHPWGEPN
jgi:hypothetical protein